MFKFLRTQLIIMSLFFGQLLTPVAILGTAAFTSSMTISTPVYAAEEGEKIDTELAMSQIVLVAIALMAPIMGINCFNTLSTKIFVAASVLYIANEIMNYSEYIKKVKAKEGGNDQQITKFDEAAGQANNAASTADKKAQWAKYAAIGFGLATVTALTEWYQLYFGVTGLTNAYNVPFPPVTGMMIAGAGAIVASKSKGIGLSAILGGAIYQCIENKAEKKLIGKTIISSFLTSCSACTISCTAAATAELGISAAIPKAQTLACTKANSALALFDSQIDAVIPESQLQTAIAGAEVSLITSTSACIGIGAAACALTQKTAANAPPIHATLASTILTTKCLAGLNLCDRKKVENTKFYTSYLKKNKQQENQFLAFYKAQRNDPYIIKALSILNELTNPSAKAKTGKGSMAALGLGGFAAIVAEMAGVGNKIASFATEPNMRALLFGAFAVLANGAADDIKSKADQMRAQANTFATLASNLRSKLDTNKTELGKIDLGTGLTNIKGSDQSLLTSGNYCATGGDKQLTLDKSCKCKKNSTCKMVNLPKKQFMKFPNGNLLSKQASFLQKMMNGAYNGNLAAAKAWGDKASALAIKINKLKGSLLAKMNEGKNKHGLQPVNFDKITADMTKSLSDQVNSAFNRLSSSQQDSVLAIAPPIMKKKNNKDKKKIAKKLKSHGLKYKIKGGIKGLNFNLAEDETNENTSDDVVSNKSDLNMYNVSGNDITTDESANIFNIISSRYFKSGYNKLFESKK